MMRAWTLAASSGAPPRAARRSVGVFRRRPSSSDVTQRRGAPCVGAPRRLVPVGRAERSGRGQGSGSAERPTVTLYGSPGSRSPLVNWYLHELGVEHENKPPGDASNPHPFGQIPALRDFVDDPDDPVELFESGAILQYLADRYGGLDTAKKRAAAGKWVVWANASLDPCLFIENERGQVLDSGARARTPPKPLERLNVVLATREWLGGDEFGVADVAVASYLLYVPQFFADASFARWPHIAKYMGRCCIRPAYAKAFGLPTAAALAERCEKWLAGT